MILLEKNLPIEISEFANINEAEDIIKKLEWELQNSTISGIGLAAPQIGINKAVAIVRIKDPQTNNIIAINLVNPVLKSAKSFCQYEEGCLSFPNQSSKTLRYESIIIETLDDYDYYAESLNNKRYGRQITYIPMFTNNKRELYLGPEGDGDSIGLLTSVCVQHEFSHLLGLNMFDFKAQILGRNELCPCASGKKNKKCHNYSLYNKNLERLFNPQYRGAQ